MRRCVKRAARRWRFSAPQLLAPCLKGTRLPPRLRAGLFSFQARLLRCGLVLSVPARSALVCFRLTVWIPQPNLKTAATAWILAGGAHHTALSQAISMEHLEDFAEMLGIEFVRINRETKLHDFRNELTWNSASNSV
ncbi:MAG: hypothetical protein KGM47_08780 [Acidobacteriota bacterium]|nr:hypothetical protein [Acidobacteriota bacterium]